jgi:hypothetical protein
MNTPPSSLQGSFVLEMHLPVLVAGLCCLLILRSACAWGPYAHQQFGLSQETVTPGFVSGCSAPDATKGLNETMHSLYFAAQLKNLARANRSAELVSFADGWACHLTHDLVGHHPAGFLNPAHDHDLELAVDALLFHAGAVRRLVQPSADMIRLVYEAQSVGIGKTEDQIFSAFKQFEALTTAESIVLRGDVLYQPAMVRDSFCNVSTFDETQRNFELARSWCMQTCAFWLNITASDSDLDPLNIDSKVSLFIERLFQSSGCQ